MTEEEIDELVEELSNDSFELYNFVANELVGSTLKEIEGVVKDLENNPIEIREFIIRTIEA